MSLAGKILIVLILLLVPLWVYEAAQIAMINRNWSQKITGIEAQIKLARAEMADVRRDIYTTNAAVALEQRTREDLLTNYRAQQANLQKIDSYTRETLDRFTFQLANTEAQVESSRQRVQYRTQERDELQKALADGLAELNTLVKRNNQLLSELADLRAEFQETWDDNKAMVREIQQSGGQQANGPRTRRASLIGR
jgi:chromosome segregation ATPase